MTGGQRGEQMLEEGLSSETAGCPPWRAEGKQ